MQMYYSKSISKYKKKKLIFLLKFVLAHIGLIFYLSPILLNYAMTIDEFKNLELEEQRKAIKSATPIGGRTEGKTTVNFYKLDHFYIEVYYYPKYKSITKCVAYTEQEFIKRYLNK